MEQALLSQISVSSPSAFRLRTDLHLVRKCWHMATGIIGLVLYYNLNISDDTAAKVLLLFAAFAFFLEYLRLRHKKLNQLIMIFMKPVMRESEKQAISGLPFYALGVSLSLFFFPAKIAILSILFLIFADPIASFFGILYGRDKILPNKSLQGTIAAFAVCYIVTLVYGLIHTNPSMNLLFFSILAGLIGAVSELCSQFVDDNLCIPVISGFGLFLLNLCITIF